MGNKTVPLLLCGTLAAGGLLCLGVALGRGPLAPSRTATDSASEDDGWTVYETELETFRSLEVEVSSAHVYVEAGDGYALTYRLPPDETVERLEVQDGTLYLRVAHEDRPLRLSDIGSEQYSGTVHITVPGEATLDTLSAECSSGNITLTGLSCSQVYGSASSGDLYWDAACDSLTLETGSGNVEVDGTVAADARLSCSSGDITFGGSCARLTAALTSGDFTFTGQAGDLEVEAASGDLTLLGTVQQKGNAFTSSGDIRVRAADPALDITGDEIEVDGVSTEGGSFTRQGSGCTLTLQTQSGEIEVETR